VQAFVFKEIFGGQQEAAHVQMAGEYRESARIFQAFATDEAKQLPWPKE
jgi:hypothetical protein